MNEHQLQEKINQLESVIITLGKHVHQLEIKLNTHMGDSQGHIF